MINHTVSASLFSQYDRILLRSTRFLEFLFARNPIEKTRTLPGGGKHWTGTSFSGAIGSL
jgi:hypothetical protein